MYDHPLIPVGATVEVVAIPYEAQKLHNLLLGYKFRVLDNEWGVYTLSCPFDITFYEEHLKFVKEN